MILSTPLWFRNFAATVKGGGSVLPPFNIRYHESGNSQMQIIFLL